MLAIKQDLCCEQAEGRSEHGLLLLPTHPGHELLDHPAKQTVEFSLDLVLDDREQAEIDEVELVGGLNLAERLRAMHCLGSPPHGIAAEEIWKRVKADALEQAGS